MKLNWIYINLSKNMDLEKGRRKMINKVNKKSFKKSTSILLWGCVGYNEVGNLVKIVGKLDSVDYVTILQNN